MKLRSLLLKLLPFLFIVLISLGFFHPVWREGQVPIPGDFIVGVYYPWLDYKWGFETGVPVKNPIMADVVSFTYPMQMLAIDLLKDGRWPLWNPYILSGTPLLANFQSAPFSPTNLVYFVFERLTAWSFQIILQHVLAAVFTYFLLRNWKVSNFGSVLGGIVFAFSGFNLLWSQWNGHALAAAFIPLVLLLGDKWLLGGKYVFGTCLSFAIALQVLSGYPQVIFYSLVALVFLWVFRIERSKIFFSKTIFLGIFSLLGLGLGAFQILPGAELLSISQRGIEPHPFDWAFLPFIKVITFFAPDYFGNHSTGNYWGPQDYTSNIGFVGVVAPILAGLALPLAKNKREVLLCFILLLVALILAFPTPFSILLWKSGFLGFQAASAHRSLVLFNLSVALLAGFGVDYFLKVKNLTTKWAFLFPGITIIGFAGYAFLFYILTQNYPDFFSGDVRGIQSYVVAIRNSVLPLMILIFTWAIIIFSKNKDLIIKNLATVFLFCLLILELFRFGWKFNPFSSRHIIFPQTPVLDFLQRQESPFRTTGSWVIPINLRMPYKLESLEGYDAVYPLGISQFISAINTGTSQGNVIRKYGIVDNVTSTLMDLVNTKYYLVIKKDSQNAPSSEGKIPDNFTDDRFSIAFEDKSVAILENKNVLPRAFMVYDWEIVDNSTALDKLLSFNFPLGRKVLLEEEPSVKRIDRKKTDWSVDYKNYGEQESKLFVKTKEGGMLFISETFYPGWKAYIDGEEEKIMRADFAFRAIPVTGGEHVVEFKYEPKSFLLGIQLSTLSLLFLLVLPMLSKIKQIGKK